MFFGWVVVLVAFAIATFGWGLGFYGLGIYLVELHRHHGWPIAFISSAITGCTTSWAGAGDVSGRRLRALGPAAHRARRGGGDGGGRAGVASATRPWQLYVALGAMAVGWAEE